MRGWFKRYEYNRVAEVSAENRGPNVECEQHEKNHILHLALGHSWSGSLLDEGPCTRDTAGRIVTQILDTLTNKNRDAQTGRAIGAVTVIDYCNI